MRIYSVLIFTMLYFNLPLSVWGQDVYFNAHQKSELEITSVIPKVDLRAGRIITVTTASDSLNGNTKSVDALLASPGPDGISLREAIAATNNTPDTETIEFSPALQGSVIYVGTATNDGLVLTGGNLIINGDIDGDGSPDITLDGSLGKPGSPTSVGIMITSSSNTINALGIVNFEWAGISMRPRNIQVSSTILRGNKIVRNVISGSRGFGIATELQEMDKYSWDIGWEETLIADNIISGIRENSISFMAGQSGASRNHVTNTIIIANKINAGEVGITIWGADGASDWTGHPIEIQNRRPVEYSDSNFVQNIIISDNTIRGAVYGGIFVGGANMGNRNNVIQSVKIIGNRITNTEWRALEIFATGGAGSRATSGNRVSDIEVKQNIIDSADIGILLGAGNIFSSYPGEEMSGNTLEGIMIDSNEVSNYRSYGLLAWAGMSHSNEYNVSNNLLKQLSIKDNRFIAPSNTNVIGLQLMGGWGYNSLSSLNRIENVNISNNVFRGNNPAVWLIGGKGSKALQNSIKNVSLNNNDEGDTASIRISDNEEDATENIVDMSATRIDNSPMKQPPKEFTLNQNYPNPFNPSTTISFSLPQKLLVSLKVFDALGKEVSTLLSEELPAGKYRRQWSAAGLPSGIYFYRLQTGFFTETKKLILLK
jgi:hypothetical protein